MKWIRNQERRRKRRRKRRRRGRWVEAEKEENLSVHGNVAVMNMEENSNKGIRV